ncbi:LuxR C-terminal-related transcriptional regulator [Streptomyces sp. NPDC001414]
MTTAAPVQPLTPSERRLAVHVVKGLTAREIASKVGLRLSTVYATLRNVRWKLGCPERCSLAVVAHRILITGVISIPTPKRAAPPLGSEQISLLRALTRHTLPLYIARAANIAPGDLRAALDQLLAGTGARDITEAVILAHGWGLLTDKQARVIA